MQKIYLWLCVAFIAISTACSKNDNNVAAPVSLSIKVQYKGDDSLLNLPKSGVTVTINNLSNGQSYSTTTSSEGVATFASITPGNYSGSATLAMTSDQYQAATGIAADQDVQFNASFTGNSFVINATLSLYLESGRVGDLVIKQFYYAGSNVTKGASVRDQFAEIYNNSNDTIYLDSLYFGNTQASATLLSAGGVPYDWSQSLNMPTGIGDASKDYIYFSYLFMIPGSGKDYPLAPGKSIVIAQTAINHAAVYTDNAGVVTSIVDPSLTVDLSKADFETYCVDYKRAASTSTTFTPYKYDLDNPLVPNVNVVHLSSGNDWAMDATGREDLIIFRIPSGKTTTFNYYTVPTIAADKLTSTTPLYAQVPVSYVLDAIEILTPLPTKRIPKRLPVSLDATGTFVTDGQYTSESLVRKTAKTLSSGRRVLQDTNNSESDFFTKSKADPSKTDASFQQ